MSSDALDLDALLVVAQKAADAARECTLAVFRHDDLGVETKADGSPVTVADRAAERAVRDVFGAETPDFVVEGEEYGGGEISADGPRWVVDPIDGTIAFTRGLPTFGTIIALLDSAGDPCVGLIDLPAIGERVLGRRGGGVVDERGRRVRVSSREELDAAMIAHGDAYAFERFGRRDVLVELARTHDLLRGYTDAFGHVQVIRGAVDAMIDLDLATWDVAATRLLIPEAGGKLEVFGRLGGHGDVSDGRDCGVVFGAPAVVSELSARHFAVHRD